MKKNISLLFIAFAMVGALSSCSQEEIASNELQNSFNESLASLKQRQANLIAQYKSGCSSNTSGIRKAAKQQSIGDLAMEMDSVTNQFINENIEVFEQYENTPEILTEEEQDYLLMDDEAFLNYVKNNFSCDFYELISYYLTTGTIPESIISEVYSNGNPYESLMLNNIEVVKALDTLYDIPTSDSEPMAHMDENARQRDRDLQYCRDSYEDAKISCNFQGAIGTAFTVASAFASGGTAAIIMGAASFFEWTNCRDLAARNYKRCNEKAWSDYYSRK